MTHPPGSPGEPGGGGGGSTGPGRTRVSVFARLEGQIATDEKNGILHRWRYGVALTATKSGKKKLPDGLIDSLIADAAKRGLVIARREIQRRVKCAEVYASEAQLRHAVTQWPTWHDLVEANFPPVEVTDEPEPDDIEDGPTDEWEQMSLLPGFKPTIRIKGQERKISEPTVEEFVAYRDKYRHMHEGFGKTLALVEVTVDAMLDGCDGDLSANGLEAYRRATGQDPREVTS